MKINRAQLLRALSMAVKIAPKGGNIPVLCGVCLDGQRQMVTATDLDVYLEYPVEITDFEHTVTENPPEDDWLEGLTKAQLVDLCEYAGVEVDKNAKVAGIRDTLTIAANEAATKNVAEVFCLPAKRCKEIVDSCKEETIEITRNDVSENFLERQMVRIGENFRDLAILPADEFPIFVHPDTEEDGAGTTIISRENLLQVLPATAKEESGFRLSVVYFNHEHGEAVATDGHRIHIVKAEVAEKTWSLQAYIAKILVGFIGKEDSLSFKVGERYVVTKIDGATLSIRPPEGKFPDYRTVINDPEQTITVKKSDALPALKQAAILTDATYGGIRVSFNGHVDVSVINPERGTYEKQAAIACRGKVDPTVEVGMRLKYVLDCIGTAPKDDTEIEIGVTDNSRGVHFKHGTDFHGMVMPMRL
uniref:Putative DNA polymerase n=1 Tax=viral metagenome TaxID=1070528 RepID=A0A6M3JN28_9ZZZZ